MRTVLFRTSFIAILLYCLFFINLFTYKVISVEREESYTAEVVVFVRKGCTHCEQEEKFISGLRGKKYNINVRYYRLEKKEDREKWELFTAKNKLAKVTPITIIGKKYLIGFDGPQTTGELILQMINTAKKEKIYTDLNNKSLTAASEDTRVCKEGDIIPCEYSNKRVTISLPFIGKIESDRYPLMILAALLGFFDGFNPCAMWVLITFLLILMQVGSRKKMLLFVGTFVLAEAIMYFFILAVWYKTWDFVHLDAIVTPFVGMLSIVGGIFFLREWRKKEIECKVTDLKTRSQTRQKIIKLAEQKFTPIVFLSILGIAFSVNVIEFACSVGIPQAFTKILEINRLSFAGSMGYIAVYILFYMIDDVIVFAIALWGFDKMHLTTRYSKISNLLGGLVMILLGLILFLQPSLLRF